MGRLDLERKGDEQRPLEGVGQLVWVPPVVSPLPPSNLLLGSSLAEATQRPESRKPLPRQGLAKPAYFFLLLNDILHGI